MKKLLPWLAVLMMLAVIFGTIYAAVQQSQRRAANYPQIQLSQDIAEALNRGELPQVQVYGRVDMAKSLAPFTIIYDKTGRVVSSSGYLDGKAPKVSREVLNAAKGKDYSAVTWQPKAEVRIAAVTVSSKDYFVLSGRSLREIEKNETRTLQLTFVGGLLALVMLSTVFILTAVSEEY